MISASKIVSIYRKLGNDPEKLRLKLRAEYGFKHIGKGIAKNVYGSKQSKVVVKFGMHSGAVGRSNEYRNNHEHPNVFIPMLFEDDNIQIQRRVVPCRDQDVSLRPPFWRTETYCNAGEDHDYDSHGGNHTHIGHRTMIFDYGPQ